MPPNRRRINPNSAAQLLVRSRMFAGQVKRNAIPIARRGISAVRTIGENAFRITNVEEAQRLAEMKRNARTRFNIERALRERHRTELKQINEELQKIIRLIKEKEGIKGTLSIENSLFLERVAMNLFKISGNSASFALEKNSANKQAMVKMLLFTERELNQARLNPARASKNFIASEQIESIIQNTVSNVLGELNQ